MGGLSPETVNKLKKRGVRLTDKEVESINTILSNTSQELSMEDLDQAVGGMSGWKKVAIGGAAIVCAAALSVTIDAAQSKIIQGEGQNATDNMLIKKGINAIQNCFSKKSSTPI